jgi:hypothetical protein
MNATELSEWSSQTGANVTWASIEGDRVQVTVRKGDITATAEGSDAHDAADKVMPIVRQLIPTAPSGEAQSGVEGSVVDESTPEPLDPPLDPETDLPTEGTESA